MWVRRRRQARVTLAEGIASDHDQLSAASQAAHPAARKFVSWQALAVLTVASVGSLNLRRPAGCPPVR